MDIKKHYKELFQKYGNKPESVQYTDKATQYKRFEVLTQIADNPNSVIDFGCGLADLYRFLQESKSFEGKYLGLDFVPEFIYSCQKEFKDDHNAQFKVFDIKQDDLKEVHEYVFLSGVFNNKTTDNKEFMYNTIKKMFNYASRGVAFNSMSTYVDYQVEHLFYSNPLEVFDFCKREITNKVVLRHDYNVKVNVLPFEYCIYLYK